MQQNSKIRHARLATFEEKQHPPQLALYRSHIATLANRFTTPYLAHHPLELHSSDVDISRELKNLDDELKVATNAATSAIQLP